jgi:hypothetical protein
MKRQRSAVKGKEWVDIAIDSWVSRQVGHPITRKRAKKRDPDWVNKAIDAWVSRRIGRPYKFSEILKKGS